MLDITSLTYRIAGRVLLEDASAQVPEGHKVGLIGRNGTGKSTLLKLIEGRLEPDAGSIRLPAGARIGTVAQEVSGGETTPRELVLASSPPSEHEDWAAPARAAEILAGLGFDEAMQTSPLGSFSGGWRMRAALAAALFADPDLLLLDEPTNHLDFEAAAWLEGFLQRWPRTIIMVSHDREFLNAVCTGILALERRRLVYQRGDYDTYVRRRAEQLRLVTAEAAKQEAEVKRIQAFIDRFRAKATKARQAQSRMKALARMSPIERIERDPEVRFAFPEPEELAPPLIALDNAAVGYGDRPVLDRLDLRLDPDDRIALLGANGNGKTTLAKLLAGRLAPLKGGRHAPSKLRVGYFAQHQVDELTGEDTLIQAMARALGYPPEQQVRSRLGRFGFGQERANARINTLSGGEKARLALGLITHDAPHLLILDEPTNHLDLDAREALVEALAEYPGAVVLVSHDRHMIELIADRLWVVDRGTVKPFDGDLDDYRNRIATGDKGAAKPAAKRTADPKKTPPPPPPAPQAVAAPKIDVPRMRRQARDAELKLQKLNAEKAALDAELADPGLYANGAAKAQDLSRRKGHIAAEIESLEALWLEAAEALEAAGAK
ncbi:MAG: ABC-F family ATP-binding cassette domain-containing protein [Alphaproteobacteria bacterium]|nr:ABC-F family ATP-binding cassette domain-containing protein [Alphaproteobacteria bacterium]